MNDKNKLLVVLGFATIYLVWGSTYLAIRIGVETIPPFLLAGVRFVVGGIATYLIVRAFGAAPATRKEWATATVIGLLLVVVGNGLVTFAEKTVPSGLTALMIAMVPFWFVIVEWMRPGGSKPCKKNILGLILGFVGVGLLINPTGFGGFSNVDGLGALIIVIATLSWATGSVYSKHVVQPKSKFLGAGMQMITGGFFLLILSFITGEYETVQLSLISARSIWSLVYLTTFGSFAFAVYIWLFKVSSPTKIATYAYVNPVIALILGNLIEDETLSSWTIFCSLIILTSVFIINRRKKKSDSTDLESKESGDSDRYQPATTLLTSNEQSIVTATNISNFHDNKTG